MARPWCLPTRRSVAKDENSWKESKLCPPHKPLILDGEVAKDENSWKESKRRVSSGRGTYGRPVAKDENSWKESKRRRDRSILRYPGLLRRTRIPGRNQNSDTAFGTVEKDV